MRILIIGNSHAARVFSNLLCENNNDNIDNIVFTTLNNTKANFVDIDFLDVSELKEFALANEINLTVLTDCESIEADFVEEFNSAGLTIFAPEKAAGRICFSKSFAKKFMYRNKIKTPKFQIFDKLQLAVDYARAAKFPIVIKPDENSNLYGATVCETFLSAEKTIGSFSQMGVKTFVIEDYVCGKEFSLYVITDGFNSFLLDFVSTKLNRFAYLDPVFLDKNLKTKIMEQVVNPTIESLARSGNNYIGILGIDLILDRFDNVYTLEYNPFFEDLDVELFTNGINEAWQNLFETALSGTLVDEFTEIKKNGGNFICAILNDEATQNIRCTSGRTLNEARENLLEDTGDGEYKSIEEIDKTAEMDIKNWEF